MSSEVDPRQTDIQLHSPEGQPQHDAQQPATEEPVVMEPGGWVWRGLPKQNNQDRDGGVLQLWMPSILGSLLQSFEMPGTGSKSSQ